MKKVLVIGCTGIAKLIIPALCKDKSYVSEICIADTDKKMCDEFKTILSASPVRVVTAGVDITNEERTMLMVKIFGPELIINLMPAQYSCVLMELALKTKASYIDSTLFFETKNASSVEDMLLSKQFSYFTRFRGEKLPALVGCSFNPAAITSLIRFAMSNTYDSISSVDIFDMNSGKGTAAGIMDSSFEMELLTEPAKYLENGKIETYQPLKGKTVRQIPGFGKRTMYVLSNPIITDFIKEIPEVENVRWFSTFKKEYLGIIKVLEKVGMLSRTPVDVGGVKISPFDYLNKVMPKEESKATGKGSSGIGIVITGIIKGKEQTNMFYASVDNSMVLEKYGFGSTEYLDAVTMLAGTILMCTDKWDKEGVYSPNAYDPSLLMDIMKDQGIEFAVSKVAPVSMVVEEEEPEDIED